MLSCRSTLGCWIVWCVCLCVCVWSSHLPPPGHLLSSSSLYHTLALLTHSPNHPPTLPTTYQ